MSMHICPRTSCALDVSEAHGLALSIFCMLAALPRLTRIASFLSSNRSRKLTPACDNDTCTTATLEQQKECPDVSNLANLPKLCAATPDTSLMMQVPVVHWCSQLGHKLLKRKSCWHAVLVLQCLQHGDGHHHGSSSSALSQKLTTAAGAARQVTHMTRPHGNISSLSASNNMC